MDLSSVEITEIIAFFSFIGLGFKGWLIVQKDLTRLDADVQNLKEDSDKDRKAFTKWFEKLEQKIDLIIEKHLR